MESRLCRDGCFYCGFGKHLESPFMSVIGSWLRFWAGYVCLLAPEGQAKYVSILT